MAAIPLQRETGDITATIQRLTRIEPGPHWVVSCYLKIEPRDKAGGKYRIKLKNRVKQAQQWLAAQDVPRENREAATRDLERVLAYFAQTVGLPAGRGVAVFACEGLNLWEVLPLPHVYRSRLAVDRTPLVRELVALEREFGRIGVAAVDRTGARFFLVTAFGVEERPALTAPEATRGSKFRHAPSGGPGFSGWGEHNYHMRIRQEKQRHYARVADHLFELHGRQPMDGLVIGGVGNATAAVIPHLHTYLHDLVLGTARLNPKTATAAEVREAALALRDARERDWERAHAEALAENLGRAWAVNGVEATLRALAAGQVRVLLVDGEASAAGHRCVDSGRLSLTPGGCRGEGAAVAVLDVVDDAIEEALRQRAQVDVFYDPKTRRRVDGVAALLRFRR